MLEKHTTSKQELPPQILAGTVGKPNVPKISIEALKKSEEKLEQTEAPELTAAPEGSESAELAKAKFFMESEGNIQNIIQKAQKVLGDVKNGVTTREKLLSDDKLESSFLNEIRRLIVDGVKEKIMDAKQIQSLEHVVFMLDKQMLPTKEVAAKPKEVLMELSEKPTVEEAEKVVAKEMSGVKEKFKNFMSSLIPTIPAGGTPQTA